MKQCRKCRTEWKGFGQPGTKATCDKCGEDLHVCLNCELYDEHKPNSCTEPDADTVQNKERFNFCDFFCFKEKLSEGTTVSGRKDPKTAFDKLFKK